MNGISIVIVGTLGSCLVLYLARIISLLRAKLNIISKSLQYSNMLLSKSVESQFGIEISDKELDMYRIIFPIEISRAGNLSDYYHGHKISVEVFANKNRVIISIPFSRYEEYTKNIGLFNTNEKIENLKKQGIEIHIANEK